MNLARMGPCWKSGFIVKVLYNIKYSETRVFRNACATCLLEVRQQNHVGGVGAAREVERLAVVGPGEAEDAVGSEIGDLAWRAAGERLFPDVRSAFAGLHELNGFLIGR